MQQRRCHYLFLVTSKHRQRENPNSASLDFEVVEGSHYCEGDVVQKEKPVKCSVISS